MKKVLFSAMALALLATSSCKKDDDNNGPSNGWVLAGTQYNTAAATNANGLFGATSTSPTGFLYVDFENTPTANGTYRVVNDNSVVGANQISFAATSSADLTNMFQTTGNGAVDATVTVNGGKITITCPDVWVKKDNATDSVKLSVNVTQTN